MSWQVGISLHYSSLSTLLWIGVSARVIYKEAGWRSPRQLDGESPAPPAQRPMLRSGRTCLHKPPCSMRIVVCCQCGLCFIDRRTDTGVVAHGHPNSNTEGHHCAGNKHNPLCFYGNLWGTCENIAVRLNKKSRKSEWKNVGMHHNREWGGHCKSMLGESNQGLSAFANISLCPPTPQSLSYTPVIMKLCP